MHQGGSNLPRHLFGVPLVLLPLLLGGARPWLWSVIAGVFAASLAWSLSFGRQPGWMGNLSWKWAVGLGLLLLYPLLQVLPLPASWMAHLSPHLLMWRDLAGNVTQAASSRFFSISYSPSGHVVLGPVVGFPGGLCPALSGSSCGKKAI